MHGCSEIELKIPVTECPPTLWWDADADKSLLIGTFRHGYEQYNTMRSDPTLCFAERCGPPEDVEKVQDQDEDSKLDNDEEDR